MAPIAALRLGTVCYMNVQTSIKWEIPEEWFNEHHLIPSSRRRSYWKMVERKPSKYSCRQHDRSTTHPYWWPDVELNRSFIHAYCFHWATKKHRFWARKDSFFENWGFFKKWNFIFCKVLGDRMSKSNNMPVRLARKVIWTEVFTLKQQKIW